MLLGMREVEFTPSYPAWTAFVEHEQRGEPLIARAQSRLTLAAYLRPVLGVPLFIFGFAWLLSWIANDINRFGFVLGFVIWVLVALALAHRSAPKSLLSYLEAIGRDAARTGTSPERQRLTLTSEGVTLAAPLSTTTMAWPLFTRIVIGKSFVTLEQRDFWSSIIIPAEAFASLDAASQFATEARSLHDAKTGGELRAVREFIDAHDVRCPSCKYKLAGIISATCPECGRRISHMTIRYLDAATAPFWKILIKPPM